MCTVYIQISKTKENVHTVAYLSVRSDPEIFFSYQKKVHKK